MSKISFVFDEHAIYQGTIQQENGIILSPLSIAPNICDFNISPNAYITDYEIATIDNVDKSNGQVSKSIYVNQANVGDIIVRGQVKADGVTGYMGNKWMIYVEIRHHDDTWEYGKQCFLPPGEYPWWQFSVKAHSDAGKTINWIYVYLFQRYQKGKGHFKKIELINLASQETNHYGEAYSRPECIYRPAFPTSQQGNLKIDLMPFVIGYLDNIYNMGSPAKSIDVLSNFPYLTCKEPGLFSAREKFVTDALKDTVKIFGRVLVGGEPLPEMSTLKQIADRIATEGWYGIYLDGCGYDRYETRARQNEIIDYAHQLGLKCMANSWIIDDLLGNQIDAVYNPDGTATHMGPDDWVFMEPFMRDRYGYRADFYAELEKYDKYKAYKNSLGIKVAVSAYFSTDATEQSTTEDAKLSYLLAWAYGFDAWWYTDHLGSEYLNYRDVSINIGHQLIKGFEQIAPFWYLAETDRYLLLFDSSGYPPLKCTIYDKAHRRELPSGNTILYSDDLSDWYEYNPTKSKSCGRFVRSKIERR